MVISEIGVGNKTYFKRNYDEVLKRMVPQYYLEKDMQLSGLQLDPIDDLVNHFMQSMQSFSSIIHVSAMPNTSIFSSMDNISGISRYFVKQNGLTHITPFTFEKNILEPLSYRFTDFSSSGAFETFVVSTLLPSIVLNAPVVSAASAFTNTENAGEIHEYLCSTLSWFYFLNTSGTGGPATLAYQPSSYVASKFVQDLYYGKELTTVDGVKGFLKHVYENSGVSASFQQYIPDNYLSTVDTSVTLGAAYPPSGLQQLELLTDIIFNSNIVDNEDNYVRTAVSAYMASGTLLKGEEPAGAFSRLLKAFSYSIYDVNREVEGLNTLYDIEKAPEDLLYIIGHLIGWDFLTHDPNQWRVQLRKAVEIYKAKGTKKALQTALQTLFASSVYDPVSGIIDLYESYIPFLVYYSLATESDFFRNFTTWTKTQAQSFGITEYSPVDMDINIRLAVDKILLNVTQSFPDHFNFPSNKYNYRGRDLPIPPWEEIKYWNNQQISPNLIVQLGLQLQSFGVRSSFSDEVIDYINVNVLQSIDDVKIGNDWIFFTSALQYPPNFQTMIQEISTHRDEFLPLWNGKSSKFRIIFAGEDFTFQTKSLEPNTTLAFQAVSRFISRFSPFHAIPSVILKLTSTDTETYADSSCIHLNLNKEDPPQFYGSGSPVGWGPATMDFETSGAWMTIGGVAHDFIRDQVKDIRDVRISGDGAVNVVATAESINRSSIRRRSLKRVLPRSGYFDRTGFNQPNSLSGSYELQINNPSGLWFPIGYLPDLGAYAPIDDWTNTSSIWHRCYGLNSSSHFTSSALTPEKVGGSNGFGAGIVGVEHLGNWAVSDTFAARGNIKPGTSCLYVDRGQLNPIMRVMTDTMQLRGYTSATEAFNNSGVSAFGVSAFFSDIPHNLFNQSSLPDSYNDFINFEFTRNLHNWYRDYTDFFNGHGTASINGDPYFERDGGFNIFSHTFGPTIFNGKFFLDGSAVNNTGLSGLIARNFVSSIAIDYDGPSGGGNGILSNSGVHDASYGTSGASAANTVYFGSYEFRNPHIVSGVEFVGTSGGSIENGFEVFRVDKSFAQVGQDNFRIENTLIKMKSKNKFNRIIFDLSAFGGQQNFLLPNSDYELKLNIFAGADKGTTVGGSVVGVWIHTALEGDENASNSNDAIWSWNGNTWAQNSVSGQLNLGKPTRFSFLTTHFFPTKQLTASGYPNAFGGGTSRVGDIPITSSIFEEVTIPFTTRNNFKVPITYYNEFGDVHRVNQTYIVEIMRMPDANGTKFLLLDNVNLVNKTLASKVVEYEAEELKTIIRYFKTITAYQASRVATRSSQYTGFGDVSGGSRLNYRINAVWTPTKKYTISRAQTYNVDVIN